MRLTGSLMRDNSKIWGKPSGTAAYRSKSRSNFSATISAIPEPGVLSMLCVGIPTMVWAARRKRRDDDHQPAAGPRRVLHRLGRQLHGDPA
jgi:hypothetical protein